jgi:predicted RecB family nuclease
MSTDKKPKTESGTPAGTGKPTGGVDLAALLEKYSTMGGNVPKGPQFTSQDAEAYVQNIYNQILGRNAVGAERTKAISMFLNQSAQTDVAGRQAAVTEMVQQTPEFRTQQENRYLDAIYNEVLQDVRRAKAI